MNDMKNFLINAAVILALLFATGSIIFGEHIVADPIFKNSTLEPLTDEQILIVDVCLSLSDEERTSTDGMALCRF